MSGPQGHAAAKAAMEGHFAGAWEDRTAVVYEGGSFDVGARQDEWVRVTVVPDPLGAVRSDIGTPAARGRYRHSGILFVECWTPGVDVGAGAVLRLADEVCRVFRQAPPAGVRFRAANARTLQPEGRWMRAQVTVPYEWDAIYEE